ncbi:MAG: flavodoxin domain-containing protein [Candidatus Methanomethylicia archaeon]
MIKILVLYYSRTGNVETLARAVAEGAKSVENVVVDVKRVDYATIEDLISCDGVAVGSPNYFGYMAGIMKDFFDKAWSVRDKLTGKPFIAFTCGGSSRNTALLSIEQVLQAFKMEKVAEGIAWGLRDHGIPAEKDLSELRKLGEKLAMEVKRRKTEVPKA